jgi:chloramphenicol 3-O phosphotransferase
MARIILLNGVGSVGKSSVAKALQAITADPFLHVSMDAFLEMMPPGSFDRPDDVMFEVIEEDGKPSVVIKQGLFADRVMRGMRHAIAAMADEGNDMIVDDVLLFDAGAHYEDVLAAHQLIKVGLFAPLDVLEERERQRGDRLIGLARWQYGRVHRGINYDLEIDTSRATAQECAQRIKMAFGL